ncbi:hypothetical protein ACNFBR_03080 [Pseudomonas sp. NY11955]
MRCEEAIAAKTIFSLAGLFAAQGCSYTIPLDKNGKLILSEAGQ